MIRPVDGYVSTCNSKTCGDSGIAIRPDSDNFPCFTGVESQSWMDATSIHVDATALSGDVNVNFRHQSVTDITSFDAEMNSYSSSCSCQGCPLCPQVLVSPSTISRTACSATDCEDGGIHIAASSEFYNATSKQWAVTLEPSCFGDIPGAAPATATASALLLAVVCGVAALPLLPLRVLLGGVRGAAVSGGGTAWWRAAAAGGAALGLAVVLLASGDFNDAAGSGGADALESCGCGATDGLKELTVTFYHAPGVLVDGASAAGMSSTYGTRVDSGVIDVNCTSNATGTASSCWTLEGVGNSSADGAVCAANAGWNNGCMEGRPLVVETGGEALRAAVQWEAVPRSSLASTSAAATSPPSSWWVPYLAEHLDSLDIGGAITVHTDGARAVKATAPVNAVARTLSVQRWVEQGRDEHASVASFNRFSLGLMARGAPPGLVRRAQQAALDETKHAELSFSLAAALNATANGATAAGDESGSVWVPTPGPIVLPNPLPLDESNEAMLRAAFREGCIGELNAAARAAAELKTLQRWQGEQCGAEDIASAAAVVCIHATHAAAALAAIADEEAGHAVLAWQSAGWLLGLASTSNTTLDAVLAEELRGYLNRAAAGGAVDAVVAVSVVAKLAPLVQEAGAGDALELPPAVVDSYAAAVAAAGAGDARSADILAGVEQLWAAVLARWQ